MLKGFFVATVAETRFLSHLDVETSSRVISDNPIEVALLTSGSFEAPANHHNTLILCDMVIIVSNKDKTNLHCKVASAG